MELVIIRSKYSLNGIFLKLDMYDVPARVKLLS